MTLKDFKSGIAILETYVASDETFPLAAAHDKVLFMTDKPVSQNDALLLDQYGWSNDEHDDPCVWTAFV